MMSSSPTTLPPVVLLGGNSFIAPYILKQLQAANATGDIVTRRACDTVPNFKVRQVNLSSPGNWQPQKGAVVVSLLPLVILAENLPLFDQCNGIVALGSISSINREKSGSARDRALAAKLQQAEKALADWSEQKGVPVVLFRSTMIYDCKKDRNVTRLAKFMLRFGFIPLAKPANGLRQPIHAEDVVAMMMAALSDPKQHAGFHNIAGGEVLTYRAMIERIAAALPRPVRINMMPLWLLRLTFGAGALLGIIREKSFDAEMFVRMNQDLVYEPSEGTKLAASARNFTPKF
jgi:hypothetical protein